MTGRKIRLPAKSTKITTDKAGKVRVSNVVQFRDASHAIRAKHSTKSRPVRRTV